MRKQHPDPRRFPALGVFALAALAVACSVAVAAPPDMSHTKHNLSTSGPGPIRAQSETRICVFCHTPHNAAPSSPLWNKELEPQTYTVYASPSLHAGPLPQPTGATKLCLSCHDGTIAMGTVLNPSGGIDMAGSGAMPPDVIANFGLDLSGHHPVSFSYSSALPNAEMASSPPADLDYGATDEVHCTTCHNPHNDQYGKFLTKDNRYSALCVTCHQIPGWNASAHATSTESVVGILPRPGKSFPTYTQLGEWGCEACHTPHVAPTAETLLNFTADPAAPFSCTSAGCHASDPGPPHVAGPAPGRHTDIAGQIRKFSAHREPIGGAGASTWSRDKAARAASREVGCADCHNPHAANDRRAEAPFASGMLAGLPGIDRNGVEVRAVTYEYEVCFKCHADYNRDEPFVARVVTTTNLRKAFDTANPSYHPVLGIGRATEVPSLPSSFAPTMSTSTVLYCTSCHADDAGGARGPHGSSFAPILKQRYDVADNTPESFETYALCYGCHDRTKLLADTSFAKKGLGAAARGGHSGHLAAGAPCSACHDPHGVDASGAADGGSHTHLINFDSRVVLPVKGMAYPVYKDLGGFSGSCTLVCHGVQHEAAIYP